MNGVGQRASSTVDRLMATARRNPEGMLLLAAGAALLMRGMGTGSDGRSKSAGQKRSRQRAQNGGGSQGIGDGDGEERQEAMSATRRYARDVSDTISSSARNVADTIGTSASNVAETISGSASRVAAYAGDLGGTAWEGSTSLIDDAGRSIRSGVARLVEEQPLAVAVLGFAAGAVAAGAIPASRVESEALRPVGQRLAATARQARGRFENAAKKAGDRLGELADEHGLNAEGLEESANKVAEAFSEGFGEQQTASMTSDGQPSAHEQAPAKQQGDPLSSAAAKGGDNPIGAQEGGGGSPQRKPSNGIE